MSKSLIPILLSIVIAMTTGCSSKSAGTAPHKLTDEAVDERSDSKISVFKPPSQRVSLKVGSRHQDSRIVMDSGVVLKIYLAAYVTSDNNLHAGSDVYARVEQPRWVVGEPVPVRSKGLTTPADSFPFNFRPDELDINASVKEDQNVKKYYGGVEQSRRDPAFGDAKDSDSSYDAKILKFLQRNGQ